MKANLRRSFLLFVSNALVLIMGAPAMADAPTEISLPPEVFEDVDPCTGELHEVTIFLDIFVHEGHPNNLVDRGVRTGTTDSGYEMISGNDLFLGNNNVLSLRFKDMWSADDGRKFLARGVIILNLNTGEFQAENFAFECIGGETIL